MVIGIANLAMVTGNLGPAAPREPVIATHHCNTRAAHIWIQQLKALHTTA